MHLPESNRKSMKPQTQTKPIYTTAERKPPRIRHEDLSQGITSDKCPMHGLSCSWSSPLQFSSHFSLSPSALKSSCCSLSLPPNNTIFHPRSKPIHHRTSFSSLSHSDTPTFSVFGFSVSLLRSTMAVAEFATTPSSYFNQAYPRHNHHYSSQFSYVTNRLFKNPRSYSYTPFPRTKNANICCSVK